MVDIDKRREWANNGTQISEPSTTLQDAGYAPLEQPYNEHHNWIWNSRDKNVNQLIEERNYSQRHAAGISIGDQVAGLTYSRDWLHPYSPINTHAFPSPGQPICLCAAWDYTLNRPCVYVGSTGVSSGIYTVRNGDDGSIVQGFIPLFFNDNVNEYPEAIVSEGDAFYVMTGGHTSGNVFFYRYSANPLSPIPIWSTSDAGSQFNLGLGQNAMCIAESFLAYVRTNTPIGSQAIRLIRKSDAGAFTQGDGNATGLSTSYYVSPGIVSNGTSSGNVFFLAYHSSGSSNVFLCGANIANPTVATIPTVGSWTRKEIAFTNYAGGGELVHDGELVHGIVANGKIASFYWAADIYDVNNKAAFDFYDSPNPPTRLKHASLAYDGLYGWALLEYEGDANGNNAFVAPVRLGDSAIDTPSADAPYILQFPNNPRIMIGEPRPANPVTYQGKMVYSDNCLWILPRINTSPVSYTMLRLPNIAARR